MSEEAAARDTAQMFAEEVPQPAGTQLDQLPDRERLLASDSLLWRVFDKHRELGPDDLDSTSGDLNTAEAVRLRYLIDGELTSSTGTENLGGKGS